MTIYIILILVAAITSVVVVRSADDAQVQDGLWVTRTNSWAVAKGLYWNDSIQVVDFDYRFSWKEFKFVYIITYKYEKQDCN